MLIIFQRRDPILMIVVLIKSVSKYASESIIFHRRDPIFIVICLNKTSLEICFCAFQISQKGPYTYDSSFNKNQSRNMLPNLLFFTEETLIRNRYFSIVFFKSPTFEVILYNLNIMHIQGNTHVLTGKFDLTNVNNMAFYISGPKLLFETTEISTHPNSTQQESNYIYLYTTKFGTSIKI